MDGTVHVVAKSWTQLINFHLTLEICPQRNIGYKIHLPVKVLFYI